MPKAYIDSDYIINMALLGLDFTDVEPDAIDEFCETASRLIDNFTQHIFYYDTFEEKRGVVMDRRGRIIIRTKASPIDVVTKLEIVSIPTERIEIALTSLDIHKSKGLIKAYTHGAVTQTFMRNAFKLEDWNTVLFYSGGTNQVPSPIKRACALLVRNLLRPGELTAGIAKLSDANKGELKAVKSMSYEEHYAVGGGSSTGFEMRVKNEPEFLFTSDIRAILSPYCKRGVL
jgi:hypothetical protein